MFVPDGLKDCIAVFRERDGIFVRAFGQFGAGRGQFDCPMAVAVSEANDVFVCDAGNERIQVFTPHGVCVRLWGSEGEAFRQFRGVCGVEWAKGKVFVRDSARVQVFSEKGEFESRLLSFQQFEVSQMCVGVDTVVLAYLTEKATMTIHAFDGMQLATVQLDDMPYIRGLGCSVHGEWLVSTEHGCYSLSPDFSKSMQILVGDSRDIAASATTGRIFVIKRGARFCWKILAIGALE